MSELPDELDVEASPDVHPAHRLRAAREAIAHWRAIESEARDELLALVENVPPEANAPIELNGETLATRVFVNPSFGVDADKVRRLYPDVFHSCQKQTRKGGFRLDLPETE